MENKIKKIAPFVGLISIWVVVNAIFQIFFDGYLSIKDWLRPDMLILLLLAIIPVIAKKYIFCYIYMAFLCLGFLVECILNSYYQKTLGHADVKAMAWNLQLIIFGFFAGVCAQIVYTRWRKKREQ